MSKLLLKSKKARLQSGFAMIEYVIVSAAIVVALFQGTPSVAVQLVEAVKSFYRALTFFISLP